MKSKRSQTSPTEAISCPDFGLTPDTSNIICKRCMLALQCARAALDVMEGRAKSAMLQAFETSNSLADVFINLTPEVLDKYEESLITGIRNRISKPGPEYMLKESVVLEQIEKNFKAKGNEDPAFVQIFWARVKRNGNFNVADGWLS